MQGITTASTTALPAGTKQYWNYGATVGRPTAAMLGEPFNGVAKQEGMAVPPRRTWNGMGVLIALLLPWTIFVAVFAVMSFGVPRAVTVVMLEPAQLSFAVCVIGLLIVMGLALGSLASWNSEAQNMVVAQPTWYTFLFLSSLLAWTLAMVGGEFNWSNNWFKYNQIYDLNVYTSVDPGTKGEQLMDAGRIHFAESAKLNFNMTMGFRNNHVFCVVPVVSDTEMSEYDFWAVGVDCCSEGQNRDFQCDDSRNPKAKSALRSFRDDQKIFFNLAVQQAESAFKVSAKHPIFLRWKLDADKEMDDLESDGIRMFQQGIGLHLLFQACLMTIAAAALKKLGW